MANSGICSGNSGLDQGGGISGLGMLSCILSMKDVEAVEFSTELDWLSRNWTG